MIKRAATIILRCVQGIDGGEVTIEAGPQHDHFVGEERNGIVSESSGSYLRSFTFPAEVVDEL